MLWLPRYATKSCKWYADVETAARELNRGGITVLLVKAYWRHDQTTDLCFGARVLGRHCPSCRSEASSLPSAISLTCKQDLEVLRWDRRPNVMCLLLVSFKLCHPGKRLQVALVILELHSPIAAAAV